MQIRFAYYILVLIVLPDTFGRFQRKAQPAWDSQTNSAGTRLFQLLLDFGLSQCVKKPTRFSNDFQSSSTIDLYATTRPDLVRDEGITDPISDHCGVTVETTDPCTKPCSTEMLIDDFSRADWPGMLKALSQAPLFTAIQGTTNIDIAWHVWYDICVRTIRPFVPSRKVRLCSNKPKGWMTLEIKRLCSRKKRLFNAASTSVWIKWRVAKVQASSKPMHWSRQPSKSWLFRTETGGSRRRDWW